MPSITTGLSLRLPSFIFSSAPHLCIQWSSSVRLTRKHDGFEAPVLIPWQDKIAYKFIVDGRWMTNDTEPTEIDHGFVNNVYTAPPTPPSPAPAPHLDSTPSHCSGSDVESKHAEKEKVPVDADKPVADGSALALAPDEPHEVPTPTAEPAPEESSTLTEGAKAVITPTVEAAHVAVAQVAPDPQEVGRASEEVRLNPDLSKFDKNFFDQIQLTPEPQAPKEPVPTAQVEVPAEVTPTAVENGVSTSGAEPPKEETLAAGEGAKVTAGPEPAPEPEPEPAVPVVEPVPEPANVEVAPTAAESEVVPVPEREAATVLESSKPAPFLAPPPAVEQDSAPTEKASPIPAAEPAVDAAPRPEPDTKSSDARSSPLPTAPAINGHTKSMSTASTSTAVPSLPTTASRKVSRKFSLLGRDKSGDSSPTGSSRFSSQQKREKRHSLLGKLKELFGDKEKEREKSVKA